MYKMQSIIKFVFYVTAVLAKHHKRRVVDVIEPQDHYVHIVNEHVQNISIRISGQLPTAKLCSQMYDVIVEKNNEEHTRIRNVSRADIVGDKFAKISDVVKQILSEEFENKLDGGATQIDHTSEFDNSAEFVGFVDTFIKTIDELSAKKFTKGPPGRSRKDFKPWVPSSREDADMRIDTNRRVYRGKKTQIKKYPFMASIHVMGKFHCGGAVISRDLVLTAASCLQLVYNNRFFNENPHSVAVRIGSDYGSHGGELVEAAAVDFHPAYNPRGLKHNVAVIRLRRLIVFGKKRKRVRRILLDGNKGQLPHDTAAIVTLGWGASGSSNKPELGAKLTVDTLNVYHLEECKKIYSRYFVTDQHFCAGYVSRGGGACNKDVGGPGVVSGRLTGIISFGPPICGAVESPTVFTRVGPYVHWIRGIIDEERNLHRAPTTLQPHRVPMPLSTTPEMTRPFYPIDNHEEPGTDINDELLRSILEDMIFSKRGTENILQDTKVDDTQDIFYGFDTDDDIFKSTKKPDVVQHPLVNKSLVFIPEVYGVTVGSTTHFYTVPTLTTSTATTPTGSLADFGAGLTGPFTLTMPSPTSAIVETPEPTEDMSEPIPETTPELNPGSFFDREPIDDIPEDNNTKTFTDVRRIRNMGMRTLEGRTLSDSYSDNYEQESDDLNERRDEKDVPANTDIDDID